MKPQVPVADPGFPVGGMDLMGMWTPEAVSKILYVKTKESRPLGGHVLGMQ